LWSCDDHGKEVSRCSSERCEGLILFATRRATFTIAMAALGRALKFPRATFSQPLLPLSSTTANTTSTASKRTLAGALNESEDATSKLSQTGGVSRYLKGFNVRLRCTLKLHAQQFDEKIEKRDQIHSASLCVGEHPSFCEYSSSVQIACCTTLRAGRLLCRSFALFARRPQMDTGRHDSGVFARVHGRLGGQCCTPHLAGDL
jgi:hypothetical protein